MHSEKVKNYLQALEVLGDTEPLLEQLARQQMNIYDQCKHGRNYWLGQYFEFRQHYDGSLLCISYEEPGAFGDHPREVNRCILHEYIIAGEPEKFEQLLRNGK
jgi:hypothetical protein